MILPSNCTIRGVEAKVALRDPNMCARAAEWSWCSEDRLATEVGQLTVKIVPQHKRRCFSVRIHWCLMRREL